MIKRVFCLLLFFLFSGVMIARAQVTQFRVLNPDSLVVIPDAGFLHIPSNDVVDMPVLDVPPEAKILVWWPDTGYDYKMPNLLTPKKDFSGDELKRENGAISDKEEQR